MHQTLTTSTIERPDWLTQSSWPFETRATSVGDLTLHYTDEGTGPAVVFVHAGMWSFIWRDVIADLSTDHRCITLDFPAAGLSDGGPSDIDLDAYTDLVNGLLDHLVVDGAVMVVHDLGGVVGMNAAARRPDRVTGLVAINSFAWTPHKRALRVMLGFMGSRFATATMGTFRVIPRMSRTGFGVGRHLDRDDRRAFFGPYRKRAMSRNFHRTMRAARRSFELFAAADDALTTTLRDRPMLTVFGEKNDQFGFEAMWRERFPHAESHIVPGGNHFPMCDAPTDVAEWIRAWRWNNLG